MELFSTNIWRWLAVSLLLWPTACTKVSFSPGPSTAAQSSQTPPVILPDGTRKETFTFSLQGNFAKVDILVVVDNSGSMAAKQLKMQAGLKSFTASLGATDWQIGLTTTDTTTSGAQGSLIPLTGSPLRMLNPSVPDFQTIFENSVLRSEIGSGLERPGLATIDAISKRNTDNAGFFRDGADLAVIILSDEDETSKLLTTGDGPAGDPNATQPQEVIDAFHNAFAAQKNLSVYGIILIPGDTACYNALSPSGSKYGIWNSQLVQQTNGVMGSICDADFGPTLANIGDHVAGGARQVSLSKIPDATAVTLEITPPDPTLTWSISGRIVTLSRTPNPGTHIAVVYKPL